MVAASGNCWLQITFGGGTADAYVAQLAADGATLDFSTYFGGSGTDFGTAIKVDGSGTIYVAGVSNSTDLPTDSEPIGPGGGDDTFIRIIEPLEAPKELADIAVLKSGPDDATVGEEIEYTVTVTNNGPDVARNVFLNDFFEGDDRAISGLEVLSLEPSRGECTKSEFLVGGSCDLGDLGVGESVEVKIKVKVQRRGEITNKASGGSDTFDPGFGDDSSNNTSKVITEIRGRRKGK